MVERVEPTAVTPVVVDPIPVAPVAVVVPPGAVTGTVVAVQGHNVTIPAGYAAGAEWQVMLPTAKVVQQSGLVGMAQLLGGADRIHINQRMMMFEALSCGMFEQKNKYDIRIGDKEGPTVMVATEESKQLTLLCCAPRHSAFVYFAPANDQNNVLLTMERPGCKCAAASTSCASSASPSPHGRRLLHVPRNVYGGGHAARRHGHGQPGQGAPRDARPLAVIRQPTQCAHAAHGRPHAPAIDVFPAGARRPTPRSRGPRSSAAAPTVLKPLPLHVDGREAGQVTHLTPKSPGEVFENASARTRTTTRHRVRARRVGSGQGQHDRGLGPPRLRAEIDDGLVHYNMSDRSLEITCCLCFCWGPAAVHLQVRRQQRQRRRRRPAARRETGTCKGDARLTAQGEQAPLPHTQGTLPTNYPSLTTRWSHRLAIPRCKFARGDTPTTRPSEVV